MNLFFSKIYWGMTAVGRVQSEWTPSGFIHFAHNPLRSYLNELQKKNKIHFLTDKTCLKKYLTLNIGIS